MTDEEFERFCLDNPDLRIERNANKEILIMSPNYTKSGFHHAILVAALVDWNLKAKRGYAFDSSAGFTLKDGSVRMPDVSWVSKEAWSFLKDDEKERFIRLCPEFVVEIKSKSDRIKELKNKMQSWIMNGAKLGWLIDPEEEKAWIYRTNGSIDEVTSFDNTLSGEAVLPGFFFTLTALRLE
jgi:Uma2 family endonuclease